ncbi:hypothetical protein JCM8097_006347 [Rhodosporidiobolus ruineniae]
MEPSSSSTPPVEQATASLSTQPTSTTTPSHGGSGTGEGALEAAHLETELPVEVRFQLVMSFRGKKTEVSIVESDTVGDLKQLLWSLTSVPPDRQKLVGLVRGKLPGDEEEVVKLGLGEGAAAGGKKKEFMMIGTPEGEEHKAVGPQPDDAADLDYGKAEAQKQAYLAVQNVRNRRKLKEATEALELGVMAQPRPGKKLLVIDLDYCVIDTKGWQQPEFSTELFTRPYLHDMLRILSPYYDFIFWSQTSWRWLETKLVEMEVIGQDGRDYNVVTTLDRTPMFSVYSEREGKPWKHEVKALGIIWGKFPDFYNSNNTIHIDDLSRNFAMNPKNGLKVHAYKDALTRDNISTDRELLHVARYLLQLTKIDDFTTLDHSKFRKSKLPLPEGVEDPLNLARRHDAPDPPAAPEPPQRR